MYWFFFVFLFNVLLSLICNNREAPLSDTAVLVLVDLIPFLLVTFATLHYFLQHSGFLHRFSVSFVSPVQALKSLPLLVSLSAFANSASLTWLLAISSPACSPAAAFSSVFQMFSHTSASFTDNRTLFGTLETWLSNIESKSLAPMDSQPLNTVKTVCLPTT